jgi:catechol 2,3-dioxygenase-like lactoylglutathione lyase family enzyme
MPIAHVTLAVRDVRRSSAFFCTALGWKPLDRPNNLPLPAAWLEIGPGQELHLVEVADFEPSAFEREFGRHVALAHPREDFAALKDRLLRQGAELVAPARDALRALLLPHPRRLPLRGRTRPGVTGERHIDIPARLPRPGPWPLLAI